MTNTPVERIFDLALWMAGFGHFVILIASFQVPSRLRWEEDLQSLMRRLLDGTNHHRRFLFFPHRLAPR